MASGLTKSEQVGLVSIIGLIIAGLFIQSLHQSDDAPQVSLVQADGWEPLAIDETDSPAALPISTQTEATNALADSPAAININSATMQELDRIPRIGPAKAEAIIQYRDSLGRFTSVDQLVEVTGIAEKTLDAMRPYITVGSLEQGGGESEIEQNRGGEPGLEAADGPKKIDINTASLEELQEIPNIGPVLAQRILEYRAIQPFVRTEDLMNIRGIAQRSFEEMRAHVIVR